MKTSTRVGLMAAGLFLLMACAWTALFLAVGRAHVETVPLARPAAEAR